MKKEVFPVVLVLIGLLFFSCSSMDDVMRGMDTVDRIGSKASSASAAVGGSSVGGVDFRKGEILSSTEENKELADNSFRAAKVITPASNSTQGQAEVLFANGDKKWVMYTLPSHKATEGELRVGDLVLYMYYTSDNEDVTEDGYRNDTWQFGRITSTDEVFKGMVEIDGRSHYIKWVRIADSRVE